MTCEFFYCPHKNSWKSEIFDYRYLEYEMVKPIEILYSFIIAVWKAFQN